MCGICGSAGLAEGAAAVKRMTAAMLHRGPDGAGFLSAGPFQLGMRRLAIIDLKTGDQPIYNEDGSVGVVLNGEIYNYRELQRELSGLGHQFKTRTDTEVVVHAYEEWGRDFIGRLRGMFALALYDGRQPAQGPARLILARDRLGIKPLYLWREGSSLLFASEVRALLASGLIPRTLSLAGLYTYLAFGSVQEPLTLIEGITSLPPGSWLEITIANDDIDIQAGSFWEPGKAPVLRPEPDQVRSWLLEAVSCHLVSDVPLGAFLSGGLDSGSITALASQALDQPLKTFTMAFDDWPADERELADLSARRWGTDHLVRTVNEGEILADLPRALQSLDQPTMDGINSWYVSREAKKAGLTVALSGVGGDELFAGYPSFRYVPILERLPQGIGWLRKVSTAADRILFSDFQRKVLAYLVGDLPLNLPYFAVRGLMTGSQIQSLLRPRASESLQSDPEPLLIWKHALAKEIDQAAGFDRIGQISWLEISQYMRSTLLRDTDMMSMAHSLEVRVPLLDHHLVERILAVPGAQKVHGGQTKPLLTRALGEDLPAGIVSEAKRTFTFPFQDWLRKGLGQEIQRELLDQGSAISPWIDPAGTARIWDQFQRGKTGWTRPWSLYILEKWIEINF